MRPVSGPTRVARCLIATGICSALLLPSPVHAAQDVAAEQGPVEDRALPPAPLREFPSFHGRLSLRYQWRDSDREQSDQDLFQYLSLDFGRAGRDAVTGALLARGVWDLDGDGLGTFGRSLTSLEDARGSSYDVRLQTAWLGFHELIPATELRVGRQPLFDTPILLHLDGLLASVAAGERVELIAYGGRPYHYWSAGHGGEAAGGVAAEVLPWRGARARVDWMHLRDATLFGDRRDSLAGARFDQATADGRLRGSAAATWLDGETRDLDLGGFWTEADGSWTVDLQLHALMSRQSANTLEFDSFTAILLDELPYREGRMSVARRFADLVGDALVVNAGAYGRVLRDPAAASEFNREYQRYWAGTTFEGFPVADTSLALTADWWDSGTDSILTSAAEFEWRATSATRFSVGSGWSLYRYDFFSRFERTGVRDHYLRLHTELSAALRLRAEVSYEEDDLETWTTAALQLEISF
ncbi:MAG TPA: hypothetical protein VGC54_06725 [Planctomycetota bacterium]